jgi:hypothetical protein
MVVVGVATVDVGAEDADAEVGVVIFGFSAVGSMVFVAWTSGRRRGR